MRRSVLAAVAAALALAGSGAASRNVPGPCGRGRAPAAWRHVLWIWLENESFDQVIGSRDAPYLTGLAHACGLATNYHAVAHPSLPNYIAATSGSTWGIADDDPPSAHPLAKPSIFAQVAAAGLSWRSYEESMPTNCDRASSGAYAVKHNPAAYYTGLRGACAVSDVPLPTRGPLPAFTLVVPNICDDMHSCPVSVGDRWMRRFVTSLVAGRAYTDGTTAIFVTFDEGTDPANHVATIVVAPSTPRGTVSATRFDHYSLLKTAEELLRLRGRLGHAGDRSTASMAAAFALRPRGS
jgi:phospholipase C